MDDGWLFIAYEHGANVAVTVLFISVFILTFYAQFMRISAHRGKKRAYVAVAHSMLTAIYHILKDGAVFKDLGAYYYNQFNKERKISAYLKKLIALGWEAPVVVA